MASSDELDLEILKQLKSMDKEQNQEEEELYARSVAMTLQLMNPEQKALAKMKIQQVLYETQYSFPQPLPRPIPGYYHDDSF